MKGKTAKINKSDIKVYLTDLLFIIVGSALYAFSVDYFIAPNNFSTGGVTGIATMFNYITGFPIGTSIIIINIPLLIFSFRHFGIDMLVKTLSATVLSSILIDLFGKYIIPYNADNKLLAAVFGGLLTGLGLGLVFLRGGTTGGTDIIAKLIKLKLPQLSMGTTVLFCDSVIILAAYFVYGNIESVLYSLIVFIISSRGIDYIVFGASRSRMMLIITELKDEVTRNIFNEINHGITLLPAEGAYTGKNKNVLMTVVRPNEVAKINKIIKNTDPNAFTVITEAAEVMGLGFNKN